MNGMKAAAILKLCEVGKDLSHTIIFAERLGCFDTTEKRALTQVQTALVAALCSCLSRLVPAAADQIKEMNADLMEHFEAAMKALPEEPT